MKAVVIHGKGDFRYEDVPDPKAGEEEVIVKIGRCGICACNRQTQRSNRAFINGSVNHDISDTVTYIRSKRKVLNRTPVNGLGSNV